MAQTKTWREYAEPILSPLGGGAKLYNAIFLAPKSAEGLEEFNIVADIACKGCLLIGGITSMGYTYLMSYSILKGLLPSEGFANFWAVVAVVFLFIIFDGFLGVTWPLWSKFFVEGKFKPDASRPGNHLWVLTGVSLFAISMAVAGISIAFSWNGAEIPVMMSLSSTAKENSDSTSTDLAKAFSNQLQVQTLIESYDKRLAEAKKKDEATQNNLRQKGEYKIKEAYRQYGNSSPERFNKYLRQAKKDSAMIVEGYESQYDRVARDMDNAIALAQSSSTRLEVAMLDKADRIQGMFDKKMDVSVWLLQYLGIIGTALFMFIKFVQTVLNRAVQVSVGTKQPLRQFASNGTNNSGGNNNFVPRGQNMHNRGNGTGGTMHGTKEFGEESEQIRNKTKSMAEQMMEKADIEWEVSEQKKNSEHDLIVSEQGKTENSVWVSVVDEWVPKGKVKQGISRHASKYKEAVTREGKENEYYKCLAYVGALSEYDKEAAGAAWQRVRMTYGLPTDFNEVEI
jgi:hypothetical protein